MKIDVIRKNLNDDCTIGEMLVNGNHECYTLEPTVRPVGAEKVFGKTAIPYGTYRVITSFSGHFQRDMPLLVGVPNFDEVRIHPGNTAANTEGCCLVGESESAESIGQSVLAFDALWPKIRDAVESGEEVWITYQGASA